MGLNFSLMVININNHYNVKNNKYFRGYRATDYYIRLNNDNIETIYENENKLI